MSEENGSMLTKIMKYGSVAVLLLASMSWRSGTNYQLLLDLAVYMSAIVMVQQAVRAQEYFWAAGLAGMVLVLNPVLMAFTPAVNLMLLALLVGLSPIVIAFAAMRDAAITLYPNLITDLNPRGESIRPADPWTGL
jgi:uncharacterized membrane protein HdeD (DUF308 family)